MFRTYTTLKTGTVSARDGDIGHVRDVVFEDKTWQIRYITVDLDILLPGESVHVKPEAFSGPKGTDGRMSVIYKKKHIRDKISSDTAEPVFRRGSKDQHMLPDGRHHNNTRNEGWSALEKNDMIIKRVSSLHLRSAQEITGYRIQAPDGNVGSVSNYYLDDEYIFIKYVCVHTGKWLHGRNVVIPSRSMSWISREEKIIGTSTFRRNIRETPPREDKVTTETSEHQQNNLSCNRRIPSAADNSTIVHSI